MTQRSCLFAEEVFEQGGHRHVGRIGNVFDLDLVVAMFEEQPQGGIGQSLAGSGLLALPARGRLDQLAG
ncbi:hypothetical protein [Nocardia terpenica]|uniref:hypothetical protein n=1 Tax=Nocardia terpenica TaxID=455432 RepID=UPI003A5BDAB7